MKNKFQGILSLSCLCAVSLLTASCGEHVHSFEIVPITEPTCTAKGVKVHLTCSSCKKIFDINTKQETTLDALSINPLGHDYQRPGEVITPASCQGDGLLRRTCKRCSSYEDIVIPKYAEHVYDCEVQKEEFVYQLGDCSTKTIYHKSCACGAKSDYEFFEGDYHHDFEKHDAKEPTASLEGNEEYYHCRQCEKNFTLEDGKATVLENNPYYGQPISLFRKDGAAQYTFSKTVREFLNLKDDPSTRNNEIAEFFKKNESKFGPADSSDGITFSWTGNGTKAPYSLTIYKDESCSEVIKTITGITGSSYTVGNLIPDTYWYRLSDSSSTPIASSLDSFSMPYSLRNVFTNKTIANMRDLGGFVNKNGKTVKYEKVYRSANWSYAGNELDEVINNLGIHTEIDVRFGRGDGSDMNVSEHPIQGVNYIWNGFTDDYSKMLIDEDTIENIKKFTDILADETNYPISYHCAAGADRTGLASFIIESILDLSDEDIYRDYELTSFFNEKRLRADVELLDEDVYDFNPNGICSQGTWVTQFGRVTSFYLEPYKEAGDSIAAAFRRFLTKRVGVSDSTLSSIQNILLS